MSKLEDLKYLEELENGGKNAFWKAQKTFKYIYKQSQGLHMYSRAAWPK